VNASRRKTLLISDLHLDPSAPEIAQQFIGFLRGAAREARALYILGDLFEAWLGDDDPDPAVRSIVRELRELRETGVATYFMHGNRDFLIGPRFATETGCVLLDDGTVIDLHGERVLLMHGDLLCTADTSYQRLRRLLRNPLTLFALRSLGLERRRALAHRLRAGSRMHVGSTAAEIMDVTPATVVEALRRSGAETLVHGHTHRPAVHSLQVDGRSTRRIVLGDWHTHGSVLEWSDSGAELRNLPR
jgi:UDP-2,3-diacylglucosamine hydrolase